MKDCIGQEINLGDVLMFTKNFSGYSFSSGMTFATKFGSKDKIGTTTTSQSQEVNDYVSYADCTNVVVFTEQAIKFYGEEHVNKMRQKVVVHEERVKEKGPSIRYFVVIEKDYSKPNVSKETFVETPAFVIQVEGKTKSEFYGRLGEKLKHFSISYNDYIIPEKKSSKQLYYWTYNNVPVKHGIDSPYSLKKIKEYGLEQFIDQRISPEGMQHILDIFNS